MAEKFIATRMYIKPLAPGEFFNERSMESIMRRAKREVLKQLRRELTQSAFSDRAKRAIAKHIRIEVKPSSLQITNTHPAFKYLIEGRKKKQMTWLTKAERPIPIITETGDLIFRWATARSMRDGRWIHPGRKPDTFTTRAKNATKKVLKERFSNELRKQIRASLKR